MLKIGYSPLYNHLIEGGHRFPMLKYDLIPEQLLYEGTISEENLFCPQKADNELLIATHSAEYLQKLEMQSLSKAEIRKMGFPLSERLVLREATIMQGTTEVALFALKYGISLNVAGGTHHAFFAHGEGFCLMNDFCIAANYLLMNKLANKILIIDLDVHQGNGTASLMQAEERVFTFSMHCGANYPLHKEKSDLDIELPVGTTDALYHSLLQENLPPLFEKVQPDFVFFLAGVDILQTDKLGRLACTREGCKQRDKFVLELCKKHQIPVAISLGGGYSPDIKDIVEAHCNTFRLAQHLFF